VTTMLQSMAVKTKTHATRCGLAPSVLFMVLTGARGLAQITPAADGQSWCEVDVSTRLTSKATLTVPIVLRNGFSLPDPQLFGIGPLVGIALSKHVTITTGYLFVELPNTGPGYAVHVPLGAITLRQKVGDVHLSDRNRAEALIGLPQSPIRYRNKLVLSFPFANERWLPFLTNETFYDFSKSYWSQNRFQAGIGRQVSSRTRFDLFYMERSVHRSHPTASHIIGLTLEIKLTRRTSRRGVPQEEN
jgi:Protein of unknown function (DUF2490)